MAKSNDGGALTAPDAKVPVVKEASPDKIPDRFRKQGALAPNDEFTLMDVLSRLGCYQATPREAEKHGRIMVPDPKKPGEKCPIYAGVFIDSIEGGVFGETIVICPIFTRISWCRFSEDNDRPLYVHWKREDVPAEDLVWGDNKEKPLATEVVVCLVLMEGQPDPFLFRFQKTGMDAWKYVRAVEFKRSRQELGPGVYSIGSVGDKDAKGNPYRRLVATYEHRGPSEGMVAMMVKLEPDMDKFEELLMRTIEQEVEPSPDPKPDDTPVTE